MLAAGKGAGRGKWFLSPLPVAQVSKLVGHKDINFTFTTYYHFIPEKALEPINWGD